MFLYSCVFLSVCAGPVCIPDFGMQLLKYYTVKQHENHLSGTWGDVEQDSGGGCRKQFDLIFLLIF